MYIVVDVESDGPVPHLFSMVCFGAVVVDDKLDKTFYGRAAPISDKWVPEALNISGFNRSDHLGFDHPSIVMNEFDEWLNKVAGKQKVTFVSDNPAYDWQWISYYLHRFVGKNRFGFSGRRIGDLYCGMMKHAGKNSEWKKKYRKTIHTHHPVDDAKGNAEALLAFRDELGLDIKF